jgi:hypothetical protein
MNQRETYCDLSKNFAFAFGYVILSHHRTHSVGTHQPKSDKNTFLSCARSPGNSRFVLGHDTTLRRSSVLRIPRQHQDMFLHITACPVTMRTMAGDVKVCPLLDDRGDDVVVDMSQEQ